MRTRSILAATAAVAAIVAASPAAAATFLLGGSPDAAYANLNFSNGGLDLELTGWTYQNNPNGITQIGQFIENPSLLYQTAAGVGVCSTGEAANALATQCPEVDNTNIQLPKGGGNFNDQELIQAEFSSLTSISQVVLSLVNATDTLNLWAVAADNSTLVHLGFAGAISGGPAGTSVSCASGTCTVNFTPQTGAYTRFLFTSNNQDTDGYRINSITAFGVPEPASWALMIMGFGGVGALLRRRRLAYA
jgi:hypothetical protein